jgi:hypothetical protein
MEKEIGFGTLLIFHQLNKQVLEPNAGDDQIPILI